MLRNVVVGIVVIAVALWAAPTSIRIAMLSGPALPNGAVLVVTQTGQVAVANLGAGVSLVTNNGGYVLQAVVPNVVVGEKPARQADGTYLLSQAASAATVRVYRNGVRQSAGDDYTYDATTKRITPVASAPWDASDLVLADYSY